MKSELEPVSCLMVTQERLDEFRRSFACFCAQDYPTKELVIVTCGSEEYQSRIRAWVESSGRTDVRYVCLQSVMPLGALRNVSCDSARYQLVCQWDDDDLYHPHRLTAQIRAMRWTKSRANFLLDHFHLFRDTGQLYWCNWARSQSHVGFPASLLAYKDVLPRYKEDLTQDEDSVVQAAMIRQNTRISVLAGVGYVYVYVYHGSNVFNRAHHTALTKRYGLEAATLRERASEIHAALYAHSIDPPVSVVDHSGREVFAWAGGVKTGDEPDIAHFRRQNLCNWRRNIQ